MADQQASSPVAAQPVSAIDALFGGDTEEDAGDPFAQLGGEATAKGEAAPRQPEDKVEPQDEEDPAPAVLAEESARPLSDPPPPAALDDKDFSDLLAEFEEEHVEEETPPVQPDLHAATEGAITPAAILIDDDQGPSAFDELLANADQFPDTDSPPPDLSIERSRPASQSSVHDGDTSLLSNTTDWLADTSMEDYFQKKPVRAVSVDTNGDEPVSFEVPQGWFDDQGNWRWYTEEEKEQVRLTMISQGGWDLPGDDGTKAAVQDAIAPPQNSPGLDASVSENAARRTPQIAAPDSPAYNPFAPPDPYTPQTASVSYDSSPAYGQTSPYAPISASQPAISPYATSPAPNPYAPSSSNPSYASSYGYSAAPPAAPAGPSLVVPPRAELPKRVVSNAYDPPFLKPRKQLSHSVSAMSLTTSSAFVPTPSPLSPPQQPATPASSGPPRRAKTPSNAPAFVTPPVRAQNVDTAVSAYQPLAPPHESYSQPIAPKSAGSLPSNIPSSSTPRVAAPPLPRSQTFNSFDPPLRLQSSSRSRMAPLPEQTLSPPSLAVSPSPIDAIAPPTRGGSRASSRKQSPMYEGRPSRPPRASAGAEGTSPLIPQREFSPPPSHAWSASEAGNEPMPVVAKEGNAKDWERSGEDEVPDARGDPESGSYVPRDDSWKPPTTQEDTQSTYTPYAPTSSESLQKASSYEPSQPVSLGLDFEEDTPTPRDEHPPHDPYAPTSNGYSDSNLYAPVDSGDIHSRKSHTSQQSGSYGPSSYAPSSQSTLLAPSDPYFRNAPSPHSSDLGISPPQPSYFQAMSSIEDETYTPQQVLDQRPVSEDPLGRSTMASRNVPLAVFGFGGVLVTGFPGVAEVESSTDQASLPSYGYASGRGQLWIRTMSEVASASALTPSANAFPGPLILDSATPKGAGGDKKKREAILAYLDSRADEIEKGLPYLKSSASHARREEEGKLVLIRLLTAMIRGDGKLSGNPITEEAVRDALANTPNANCVASSSFRSLSPLSPVNGHNPHYLSATHTLVKAAPGQLAELSSFLIRGENRKAARYAADTGLWSHALVISSSVDAALWSEIVMRFATAELGSGVKNTAALKASYSVFAGRTATSVDDLMEAASLTDDPSQDQWREVISAVVFNGKPADLACLDELGTRLRKAGLNFPAHVCHFLSPTSPFSDILPSAFERTVALVQNPRDDDAILFAEVAEYARNLITVPKGQEQPFPGLPQLLPYKLQRAWLAAEIGDVDQAQRYCSAVEAASRIGKNGPSLLPGALLASLEDLNERLTGTPSTTPAKLVIAARKAKPGFDKLGSWIEGRLTKFIAGEEDSEQKTSTASITKKGPSAPSGTVGPFSHFSTISPAASGPISRVTSTVDFGASTSQLGVPNDSRRTSPTMHQSSWGDGYNPTHSTSSSMSYDGEPAAHVSTGSGYSAWTGSQEQPSRPEVDLSVPDDEGGFINPMAALSLDGAPRGPAPDDYAPPPATAHQTHDADEDEDLGFGNASLSRTRTPRPGIEGSGDSQDVDNAKTDDKKANVPEDRPKMEPKGSWLGRWWGKKEGESSGPVRAKLGEESSMVFDKDLRRWVVKGTKGESSVPPTPPPPTRAQTVSPSRGARSESGTSRAMSTTPPPSRIGRNDLAMAGPPSRLPRSTAVPMGFTEANGGIKRMKSSLAESAIAEGGPPSSGPPGPPGPPAASRPPTRPSTASIDDLLSRPPSKRPGSVASRKARNKYVDVFQPGADGK